MWYRQDSEKITLTLHVQPGAKKTEVAGLHGEALKIRLNAPPVEGQANARLVEFLADKFSVPRSQVLLKQGETSRRKVIEIRGSKIAPQSLLGESLA